MADWPLSALIWGAYGFIGRPLTNALLKHGWLVTAVGRPGHTYDCPGGGPAVRPIVIESDDYSGDSLRRAISECTLIYNLAGSSRAVASNRSPLASLHSHYRIQLRFLQACAAGRNRPHIVFPNSRLVYGKTGLAPVSEDHALNPQSIYAAHKVENCLKVYARLGHVKYTICRISNVYGYDESHRGTRLPNCACLQPIWAGWRADSTLWRWPANIGKARAKVDRKAKGLAANARDFGI